jgi:putative hemolysin
MKFLNLILMLTCFISIEMFAAAQSKKQTEHPKPPQLKSDEYALFLTDKYIVFKTKKTDQLEFDLSCYKKNKLDCLAFEISKNKIKNVQIENPGMNNMAALYCAKAEGRNLLALDHRRNEKDFCRFSDNSMVSSWSLYLKFNPVANK